MSVAPVTNPRIIVAFDCADADAAMALAARLDPRLCRAKVGKELFTVAGPSLVARLQDAGYAVFLDLKFHDIPNTVASACRAAAALGVWMVNVHALGGRAMMSAAREALGNGPARPRLIAVTVLTSLTGVDLAEVGISGDPPAAVGRLARLARDCALDGVVCSAQEAAALRRSLGSGFLLVTPGVRPVTAAKDDQQRVATPRQAMAAGADYIVIGRPVTHASDPRAALQAIADDLST